MNDYELGNGPGLYDGLIGVANAAATIYGATRGNQAAATAPPPQTRTVPLTATAGVPVWLWLGAGVAALLGLVLVLTRRK